MALTVLLHGILSILWQVSLSTWVYSVLEGSIGFLWSRLDSLDTLSILSQLNTKTRYRLVYS